MNISLKTKVTAFVALAVLAIGAVSTFLFFSAYKRGLEREVLARGIALSEALARALDDGLAAEDLNLIKQVEDIVHTDDVVLAQVFSSLWLGVASVPVDDLHVPPSPAAIEYFKEATEVNGHYYEQEGRWINVYAPVFLDPHDSRISGKILIGYVRLRISTEPVRRMIGEALAANILVAALLTVVAVLLLDTIIARSVLTPILKLHASVSRHREGEFPESVPVSSADEIGELSSEFNRMGRALREREERLAEEKERLAVTLRSIGDGVIVTDIDGIITLMNRVAEQHTGWAARDASGRRLAEVFHIINEKTRERCENPVERVISSGLIVGLANHTALIRKDGTEIIIEDSAAPIRDRESRTIGVVLVFRDATAKRRTEEELLKVEKLQSVGLLAGGLAHDFNNLLTAIAGNISLAKRQLESGSKAQERLAEAEKATRRAADLTHQLLTFSKGGAPVKRAASIMDIAREAASFTLSGTNVAPEFIAAGEVWNVDIDPGQMSQVFHNLILNAVHAMPNGGKIVFTVENVVLADHVVPSLNAGAYVKVSLRDTGTGIPGEHVNKIFDPYFTTKQKGSGLGLTSAYSVVKRHDGHMTVESKPGKGATFHLYLPATPQKEVSACVDTEMVDEGQGTVLIMDDEQVVRDISGEMLRTLGYDAEFAENGADAVALYQKALAAGTPYAAVIMDLTIPGGMGGKEVINRLRDLDPGVKAIVSSGYSNDPVMANFERFGFKGVITKPYTMECFGKTLREVIKGQRGGEG